MAILSTKPTQNFVPIQEIRDGVVVLKNKSMRMILMASTLNFALKSEDEQNAIILQYQNFLNSLDFSIQFFVSSRKLNISPYLATLNKIAEEQTNELLEIQTREYTEFIKSFVKSANIMTKTFYVVIPYTPSVFKITKRKKGLMGLLGGKKETVEEKDVEFEENRLQLQQRIDVVRQGLMRAGIRTVLLETEELVELFYKMFNPGETETEVFKDGGNQTNIF